jgi:hypothetical protein
MKILQAKYAKFEDIPPEYNKLFEKKGDEYVLMEDAIEGAAALLNPGLAANRDRVLDEKTKLETRVADAESKQKDAENKLKQIANSPDSVLTSEDLKTWQKLKNLGDINEIVKRFNEFPKLESKVKTTELETTLGKVQKALNLPPESIEALRDTLENPKYGEGLEVKFKKTEVVQQNGNKETVETPYFSKKTKTGENTFQETEYDVLKYASENFPSYVTTALSAKNEGGQNNQIQNGGGFNNFNLPVLGNQNGGISLPIIGGSQQQQTGGIDPMKIVNEQNAARDTRQSPFAVADNNSSNAPQNNNNGAK